MQPTGGRSIPVDARTNDLAAWRTIAHVIAPRGVFDRLVAAGFRTPSVAPVAAQSQFVVRDPDGHLVHVR